jgi:CubicO group peptidase (beta-lactamase class C family)
MADTLTAAGLAALHDAAEKHVANGTVPGLVALVASGDDVHVETAGQLSIGGPPMARDSLFRIASMTKPVTGAGTMALIEEGLIDTASRCAIAAPSGGTVDSARRGWSIRCGISSSSS